jgi:predicted HTH domain antitoxin
MSADRPLQLFEAGEITLVQAAEMAGLSVEGFLDLLSETEIPAVDYSPDELVEEWEIARTLIG